MQGGSRASKPGCQTVVTMLKRSASGACLISTGQRAIIKAVHGQHKTWKCPAAMHACEVRCKSTPGAGKHR